MSHSPAPTPLPSPRVCILMAVYKGEAFLTDQLDSLAAQTHDTWNLIISDDSPNAGSADVIAAWHAAHPDRDLVLKPGPRQGSARNFLSLLATAPTEAAYIALSDQDDIWYADKLERAIQHLAPLPTDQPALYCAATMISDRDARPIRPSPPFRRPPSFRNALIQSIGGGNTMVLNRAAADLVRRHASTASDPVAHDWWLYQIITGHGGRILRDDDPVLFYRQHGGNQIGANTSTAARLTRIRALLRGRFRDWNTQSLRALEQAQADFLPDARDTLAAFRKARQGPWVHRLRALRRSGVLRQSALGTAALYLACLLNRL